MTKPPKLHLTLPQHWTPAQALAAFEMIDLIRDRLWLLYADDIQTAMRHDRQHVDPRQLRIRWDSDSDPF